MRHDLGDLELLSRSGGIATADDGRRTVDRGERDGVGLQLGEARIRFVSPPETLYYAAGVSYRATGDVLQVVIDRCPIHGDCTTMAKGTLLDDGRTTEVSVPLDGRRLVVLHTDGEQPLP